METRDYYIDQYRELHASKRYGVSARKRLPEILGAIGRCAPVTILDYGCGQARLKAALPAYEVTEYDPAIPGIDGLPAGRFDLVLCLDVMEHIPEEGVGEVLREIVGRAPTAIFVISTQPAVQRLPDGQNAHCTVRPSRWWEGVLGEHFGQVTRIGRQTDAVKFYCTNEADNGP